MNDLAQMSGIVGGGEEQDSGSRYSSTLGRHTTGLDISANTRGKQDPRTLCEPSDAFSGGIGSQSTRGYQQTGGNKRKSRFSFGKLVGDVIVNSLLGGLTSTMYYGADRAVGAVSDGIRGKRNSKIPESLLQGKADTRVYLGIKNGKPNYVGITNDIERRQNQHGDRFDYLQEITSEPLTRRQARSIEQVLIENNSQFSNKINSISPKRNWYNDAKVWGSAWLKRRGYLK